MESVVQFGLEMIPFGRRLTSSGLTSGTTSGTSGSILKAPELSTQIAPRDAAIGAHSAETSSGTSNIATSIPKLYEALAIKADLELGRRIWDVLWSVCDLLESYNYVAAIKGGLDAIGESAGPVRAPLQPIDAAAQERLGQLLRQAQAFEAGL